jgi:hypothetical protein
VLVHRPDEAVVKISINRPDVMNVISRKVYAELDRALATAEEDAERNPGSAHLEAYLHDWPSPTIETVRESPTSISCPQGVDTRQSTERSMRSARSAETV